MSSSENFGSNDTSFSNGGILPPSLLESASLGGTLDDNSALSSLQITLKTPSGSDPISSELERLEKSKNVVSDRKSNQSATNYTNFGSNVFNPQQLYNQSQNFTNPPLLLTTSKNKNFHKTKAKDLLTGNTTDTTLVGTTEQNYSFARTLASTENFQENSLLDSSAQKVQANSNATEASSQTSTPNFVIRTEGTISINNGGDFDGVPTDLSDDALIYAAQGFTINGNPVLPVQRDASGNPIRDASGKLILVDKAIAVAAGYTLTNGPSNEYAGLIPPQVVAQQTVIVPAYADVKHKYCTCY